ncbi:hypothetical protein PWT90_05970 [Aphanocladium album]|nr:hypothetical protein PWT90_05970 [Aphanocladium album]
MKTATVFAAIGLAGATAALPKSGDDSGSGSDAGTCTANLLATLCDYPSSGSAFNVASGSPEHCWRYCYEHGQCNFAVFVKQNPFADTGGSCSIYPGRVFDKTLGEDGATCSHPLTYVYDAPKCEGVPTPSDGVPSACAAAVGTPSAVAEVCNYPAPSKTCFSECALASGASHCLSMCAKAEKCSYVVFYANNEAQSPFASGNCWMYPEGSYDSAKAGKCDGKPNQFVYKNTCPPPPPKSTSTDSSPSATATGGGGSGGGSSGSKSEDGSSQGTATKSAGASGTGAASATKTPNAAPTALAVNGGLAMGAALLLFNGI